MLWPNGTSTTAAGTGTCGLSGTGGLATMAAINPGWASLSADPFYAGTWLLAEQVTWRAGRQAGHRTLCTPPPVCASARPIP